MIREALPKPVWAAVQISSKFRHQLHHNEDVLHALQVCQSIHIAWNTQEMSPLDSGTPREAMALSSKRRIFSTAAQTFRAPGLTFCMDRIVEHLRDTQDLLAKLPRQEWLAFA